ncbi:MAG: hypothetical protein ACO4CS_03920 [bacterium]
MAVRFEKPPKDHSHYGPEVQQALLEYQDKLASYIKSRSFKFKDNAFRQDAMQLAWDNLARARKMETGSGFYLSKEAYMKNSRLKKKR